jgi:UDP-N-acetylmuramoyl-L-alanyl-D-glutamate--2,6-diaminopimelate ligase
MLDSIKEQMIDTSRAIDFTVSKLCYDSRYVESGNIFFAVRGFKADGNLFINEALLKGAQAVITDGSSMADSRVLRVKNVRKAMALMSAKFYDNPSSKMKIIGVTGTNGKTTTSALIYHILYSNGKKCGLIGTNGNLINNRFIKTSYTTPESVELQSLLKQMADERVEFVSMEVSSHALAMYRVYGIDFDMAVYTNLTPEHLDFHTTMEDYFITKRNLFDSLKRINIKNNKTAAVYNIDDEYGKRMVSTTEAERISYGLASGMYECEDIEMDFKGTKFTLLVPRNGENTVKLNVKTNLTGKFNIYNTIAAIAASHAAGLNYRQITSVLKDFKPVDGRFNQKKLKKGTTAIVDYSHTPDSLLKALITIKEILSGVESKGKIITVFGCGGGRDKTKRPVMGNIAAENSYMAIITSDNPRDEDPLEIINEIKSGIKKNNYLVIENREEAIKKAIELSGKNDVVLVAGKGHETYQEIKGVKHHFSDKEVIEKYI